MIRYEGAFDSAIQLFLSFKVRTVCRAMCVVCDARGEMYAHVRRCIVDEGLRGWSTDVDLN